MIRYRESETINYEKIIIALLYNLYKEKRPLTFSDEELKKATNIQNLQSELEFFIGNITFNLSEQDKEQYITNSRYLVFNNDQYRLKEQINEDYIDYLAHTIDKDLLSLLTEVTHNALSKKYIETVQYKSQVLSALYILNKDYGIRQVTSEELRTYRIVLAEYLAARNERVNLEANKEAIENFQQVYKYDIRTIYRGEELTYILQDNLTLSELEALVKNNVLSHEIDFLTNKDVIESSFIQVKKLKL